VANAAGWNPSDKSADITLGNRTYLGNNTTFVNSANSSWRSLRSSWSASTGKYIIYFQKYTGENTDILWGLANGSFDINTALSSGATNYAIYGDGKLYFNGAVTYSIGKQIYNGSYMAIAVNLTDSRLHFRCIGFRLGEREDTGWINWAGTASDPTNSAQGTDISGLGTPVYAAGTSRNNTAVTTGVGNFGGWPPLTDLIAIPSGYTMPDANYPFTIPSGTFTVANNTDPTNIVVSQNNMRGTVKSSSGANGLVYSSPFPAASKTIHAIYWDSIQSGVAMGHLITNDTTPNPSNCAIWFSDGTTRNLGGLTWRGIFSTETTYMAIDRAANRAWITVDGTTWYGNGGASPNPATNTNGADISGLTGTVANQAPGIYLGADNRGGGTFNAGRLADTFTVPTTFRWLDSGGILRSRVTMG